MRNEEEIRKIQVEMIKALYIENFQRDITEGEIKEIFQYLFPRMEEELKTLKGFSDSEFERYMSNKSNELLFSPDNVRNEVIKALTRDGEYELTHARRYKRLREMEIATRYCFANYKKTGDMLMIKGQDNPDIVFVLMGDKSSGKHIKGFRMEVMTIPQIAKDELKTDLPTSLTEFIREKKFDKAYGLCSLIVGLDFNHQDLDIGKLATEIQKVKPNPYNSIWLTFINDEDGKTVSVVQIYPVISRVDYNLTNERSLLY